MGNIVATLQKRGFIHQLTDENLTNICEGERITCYAGFDPTASSLHVGSLIPVMGLIHFQRHGHRPIVLVGGATGMIGDPSGKKQERKLLSNKDVENNIMSLRNQLEKFLEFGEKENSAIVVNNADWLLGYGYVDFLRDIGKYIRLSEMLAKESVAKRLESKEGMSFTEFGYMPMQAYDFLYLLQKYNCTVQIGGQDQWGNITLGIDLIRRLTGKASYGLTFPLLESKSGQKFGKSENEEDTIWLDPQKTLPYEFYQFWMHTDDQNIIQFLNFFTFLPDDKINELEQGFKKNPEKREAQRVLAYEVTKIVHGAESADLAEKASNILFSDKVSKINDEELQKIFYNFPSFTVEKAQLTEGIALVDILKQIKISESKTRARELIESGGVYINNNRIQSKDFIIKADHLVSEHIVMLRTGKKNYYLIKFI